MSPRRRAAKKLEPTSPQQAEAQRMVEEFRRASMRIRGLATTLQGHRINSTVALAHADVMRRACKRLQYLGHKDIGDELGVWHQELEHAQRATDEAAKRCRQRARALTMGIDLKVARITA